MNLYIGDKKIYKMRLGSMPGTLAISAYTPKTDTAVLGEAVISQMKLGR